MQFSAERSNMIVLAGIQGVAVFTALLPEVLEVKRADPEKHPHVVEALRIAEFTATAITVSVATLVSVLSGTVMPVVVALMICAVIMGIYEVLLRSTHNA